MSGLPSSPAPTEGACACAWVRVGVRACVCGARAVWWVSQVAGFTEPLMALCEVAYADVLCELFESVAVLRAPWQRVCERVRGVVGRIVLHRDHYHICEARVKGILHVLIELWESARQCGAEDMLTFHMQHENYKGAVKRTLAAELAGRLEELLTRLSAEALELHAEVRAATGGALGAAEPTPAGGGAEASGVATDLLSTLLEGGGKGAGGGGDGAVARRKGPSLARSLKRAVRVQSAHSVMSSAFGRAHAKTLAVQVEEQMRAADARAAVEYARERAAERAAEEGAAMTLQGAQRGRVARGPRGRIAQLRRERSLQEAATERAARRAAAREATEEAQRHRAASTMQARQKGILARQEVREMREVRAEFRRRMRLLRAALKAKAAAAKVARQLAEEAGRRRARLAEESSVSGGYRMTERRLDLLELADTSEGGPRHANWSDLKERLQIYEAERKRGIGLLASFEWPAPPPIYDQHKLRRAWRLRITARTPSVEGDDGPWSVSAWGAPSARLAPRSSPRLAPRPPPARYGQPQQRPRSPALLLSPRSARGTTRSAAPGASPAVPLPLLSSLAASGASARGAPASARLPQLPARL